MISDTVWPDGALPDGAAEDAAEDAAEGAAEGAAVDWPDGADQTGVPDISGTPLPLGAGAAEREVAKEDCCGAEGCADESAVEEDAAGALEGPLDGAAPPLPE